MRAAPLVILAAILLAPAASAGFFPVGTWTFRLLGHEMSTEDAVLWALPGDLAWSVTTDSASYDCYHLPHAEASIGYGPHAASGAAYVTLPGECGIEERDGQLHVTWRDVSYTLRGEGTFS